MKGKIILAQQHSGSSFSIANKYIFLSSIYKLFSTLHEEQKGKKPR
jgi:hypothetical protein